MMGERNPRRDEMDSLKRGDFEAGDRVVVLDGAQRWTIYGDFASLSPEVVGMVGVIIATPPGVQPPDGPPNVFVDEVDNPKRLVTVIASRKYLRLADSDGDVPGLVTHTSEPRMVAWEDTIRAAGAAAGAAGRKAYALAYAETFASHISSSVKEMS